MNRCWIPISAGVLFIALGMAWWQQGSAQKPVPITPGLTGAVEYCLTCHADLQAISSSHPVETFGCVLCHGGERLALDADLAHSSMRGGKNPSNLAVVEASCGGENCHSGEVSAGRDHISRVQTSIQSTYTGAITLLRYSFGAQVDLLPRYGVQAVSDTSLPSATGILHLQEYNPANEIQPALQAFGKNCLTCHLSAVPREEEQYLRLTGCAACHSPYQAGSETVHTLTTSISYKQCNTCHNRGNYDLRVMEFVERSDQPLTRIEEYYQPIAQFTRCEYTLDCVDCHTRTEVMGDGDIHANKVDARYVQCSTCHGTPTALPQERVLTDPGDIAFRMTFLNPGIDLKPGDTILLTEKGEPLWNTLVMSDGVYQLTGKVTGQTFLFQAVMGSSCTQEGEDQSSAYCHLCHAVKK